MADIQQCWSYDDFDLDDDVFVSLEETIRKQEENYFGNPKHYMLFSGAAMGSDTYWQKLGAKYGVRVKAFSFKTHNRKACDRVVLSDEQLQQADDSLHMANKTLKRRFPTGKAYVNNLLRRNWHQVKDTSAVFAIGKISVHGNIVEGGTGWAVQMAVDARKPVYVFDIVSSGWKIYDYGKKKFLSFKTVPRLSLNFTGIGTRPLPENGKAAIEKVFQETFGKLPR
ncbi:uncharacterized protein [Montipora foliosa]|uniref:uncharacterized protein n=1 Tax=Montipora foliosa TaxID=591990 RepID=UPI0035F1E47C